jgi:hypothetical protein
MIWRKGLLLELHDGPIYFLDFKNADLVASKINENLFESK